MYLGATALGIKKYRLKLAFTVAMQKNGITWNHAIVQTRNWLLSRQQQLHYRYQVKFVKGLKRDPRAPYVFVIGHIVTLGLNI